MKRDPWAFHLVMFIGLWLLLGGFAPAKLFRDPGTFWHTAIGQQILETGELPRADSFSYTRAGEPWVSQFWLSQVGMARLHAVGGWDALLVVTLTVLAATFAWLASRLYATGLSALWVALLVMLAYATAAPQFHVRPTLLTISFLAILFSMLVDVEGGRRPLRHLWWLVPLLVLWTNVHGGVLGGLGTLGLVVGGWLLLGCITGAGPLNDWRSRTEGFALLIACGMTVLVNPYGLKLPELWLAILKLPLAELIQEHGRLWRWPTALLVTNALAAMYLIGWFTVPWRRWRVTWFLPPIWFLLAWLNCRHGSLFAVVSLLALADLLPASGAASWLNRRGWFRAVAPQVQDGPARNPWYRLALPVGIVLTALALQANSVRLPLLGSGWLQLDTSHWPVDLEPELDELSASNTQDIRLFNDMLYGGYLIFHHPRIKVFIDDRCELYGEAFLRRYVRAVGEDPTELERWDQKLGFTHALVTNSTPIEQYLQSQTGWKLLQQARCASLYERVDEVSGLTSP